jgi:hypothetical protein
LKEYDNEGDTALSEAAFRHRNNIVMKFLCHRANMPQSPVPSRVLPANSTGLPQISEAIKKMIAEDRYNSRDYVVTIMFWAVINGCVDLMETCFERDSDSSLKNWRPEKATWLHIARNYGQNEIMDRLISMDSDEFNIEAVAEGGKTNLYFAVESGRLEAVRLVLFLAKCDSEESVLVYWTRGILKYTQLERKKSPLSLVVKSSHRDIERIFWSIFKVFAGDFRNYSARKIKEYEEVYQQIL